MTQDDIISEAVSRLLKHSKPVKIILFGSRARGEYDNHSDLDILVICPFTGERRKIISGFLRKLNDLELAIDIIVLSPEEFECDKNIPGTIARPAWLEGKVLYEAA